MSSISVAGDVSGAISIAAPSAAGSGTLTLPVATDTLVGKATTDTLTNKSIAATQLTGTIAAAALPAGSVLQVVNATTSTTVSNSTTTYADTTLTATITPRSTSSKILAFIAINGMEKSAGNVVNSYGFKLLRDATLVTEYATYVNYTNSATALVSTSSYNYLDSPSSTSALVYKVQFKNMVASSAVYVQTNSNLSTITLMEIAG
jgi:hypothetical protein